jgi:carboxyl-terminal processing protease
VADEPGTDPDPLGLDEQVDRLGHDLAMVVALVFAGFLHLLVGWFHLTVGLIVPAPVALGLQLSWVVVAVLIWRLRRSHALVVLSLPFVSALLWLAVVGGGSALYGWEAAPDESTSPVAGVENPAPATGNGTAALPRRPLPSPSPRDIVVTDCAGDTGAFALLCEVADLVADEALEVITADVLAEAAVSGVPAAGGGFGTPLTPPDTGRLACALPDPAYRPLCDAVASSSLPAPAAVEAAVRTLLARGVDRFSRYTDPASLDLEEVERDGTVEGIGALVTATSTTTAGDRPASCDPLGPTCRMRITSLLPGSPAIDAGVRVDDVVLAVDGTPVDGRTLDEVTRDVRGPAGTEVRLRLQRDARTTTVVVTRAAVTIPVVESDLVTAPDGTPTGVLALRRFSADAGVQVRAALQGLLADGAEALVLDLRANPGGSLDATVEVASEFLADGEVLLTRSRDRVRPFPVIPGGVAVRPDLPLWVLVDGGSASASEIVAATLQEAGRAVVLGSPSFGKGSVQQRFGLDAGGEATLTVARWETPSGFDVTDRGVRPDVPLDVAPDVSPEVLVAAVTAALAER